MKNKKTKAKTKRPSVSGAQKEAEEITFSEALRRGFHGTADLLLIYLNQKPSSAQQNNNNPKLR